MNSNPYNILIAVNPGNLFSRIPKYINLNSFYNFFIDKFINLLYEYFPFEGRLKSS